MSPSTLLRAPSNGETRRREIELDFLRGIAILLVLDFHVQNGLLTKPLALLGLDHIGWIGVNVFFVLSGFLVGGLLISQWKKNGRIDAGRFLLRRGLKIWPQYYAYVGLILLTGHRSWGQMWGNLVHLQNYVGGVPHTWTLAVEEHAYLLLVLCLVIVARNRISPRVLFVLLACASISESGLRLVLAHEGRNFFFMTHTSLDGILDGALLALLFHFAPRKFERLRENVGVIVTMMIAAFALIQTTAPNRLAAALHIDGANLFAMALFLLLSRPGKRHGFAYRAVAKIGIYSYGIYLWHVSLLAPLGMLYQRLPEKLQFTEPVIFVSVAVLVGAIATRMVEWPVLHFRDRMLPAQTLEPGSIVEEPTLSPLKRHVLSGGPAMS